jgi:hypothetical protein
LPGQGPPGSKGKTSFPERKLLFFSTKLEMIYILKSGKDIWWCFLIFGDKSSNLYFEERKQVENL